jgi:hypothetical protein
MPGVPLYADLLFMLTTFAALFFFWKASRQSTVVLAILSGWLILQWFVARSGFYQVYDTIPPRFALLILPPTLTIIGLLAIPAGRRWINSLNQSALQLVHAVRVPVEICLYWLSLHQFIPTLMTFEGGNWDILSGLTAPFVYFYGYRRPKLSRAWLLAWNLICLLLLVNIVARGVLSAPSPFQQLSFDRPNLAIFYAPYAWLPAFIVPLVLFAHLVNLRALLLQPGKP